MVSSPRISSPGFSWPRSSSSALRTMCTKDEPVLDSGGIDRRTRFLTVSPGSSVTDICRISRDDQPSGRVSSALTFSRALPEFMISKGTITSLPAWPLMGTVPGRRTMRRTRLTTISTGTTSLAEPPEENRASAAISRPASALAGMPIVIPTRLVADAEKDRLRAPSTTKSPRGTISTSTLDAFASASGIGIETTW